MKLIYLWVENYIHIKEQGYLLNAGYDVKYDRDGERHKLSISEKDNIDGMLYGDKIAVTAIVGDNGAGKSTFLTIAGALQKPTSGEVFIGGDNVTNYSPKQADALRLDKIGFVLQAYNLVPYLTVREQFILVDKVKKTGNLSKEALDGLLDELGISQLVNKYPKELSGGQQQRVAIARALYADPAIILADEPTASLDSEKVEEVGKLFKTLAKQKEKAIILVTHDLRLNKYSDKIYEMLDGRLSLKKGN